MRWLFGTNGLARRTPVVLCCLGVVYCGLNAFKAVQIDDTAYFYFARQIAHDPLNPYGFEVLWYQVPEPANQILAPPVLPYSWALALRVCGDSPVLCKLFLLPWSLLLMFGLHALFRRFAPGWEMPLTAFTAFSPALLPSLNFMLDVPSLGLSLLALHLFLRACDEDDVKRAVLAGLLAGLAVETKYTGLIAPGVMLAGGLLFRRRRLIPAALLTTAQVFVCWELLMALSYGRSHFFLAAAQQSGVAPNANFSDRLSWLLETKGSLVPVLFTLVGSVAPPLIVLGLAALGVGRRWLQLAAGLLFLGVLWIVLDYANLGKIVQTWYQSLGYYVDPRWKFKLSDFLFLLYGVAAFIVLGAVAVRLLYLPSPDAPRTLRDPHLTIFLLIWLGLEIAGYFLMTPFPAVRRVLGVTVVATLLTGRLVALTCRTAEARYTTRVILVGGIALGLAYFTLDCRDAAAQKIAADEAADYVQQHGGGRVWYVGHWGFQYYAEHRGMRPAHVYGDRIEPGDWYVAPDEPHNQQAITVDPRKVVEADVVIVEDWVPLRTVENFYGGTAALEHHDGPRMRVRVYRVVEGFVPEFSNNPSRDR